MIRIDVICDECGALTCNPWTLVLGVQRFDEEDARTATHIVCGACCATRVLNRLMFPLEKSLEKDFTHIDTRKASERRLVGDSRPISGASVITDEVQDAVQQM